MNENVKQIIESGNTADTGVIFVLFKHSIDGGQLLGGFEDVFGFVE